MSAFVGDCDAKGIDISGGANAHKTNKLCFEFLESSKEFKGKFDRNVVLLMHVFCVSLWRLVVLQPGSETMCFVKSCNVFLCLLMFCVIAFASVLVPYPFVESLLGPWRCPVRAQGMDPSRAQGKAPSRVQARVFSRAQGGGVSRAQKPKGGCP